MHAPAAVIYGADTRHDPSAFSAYDLVYCWGCFEGKTKALIEQMFSMKPRLFKPVGCVGAARAFALGPEERGCLVHGKSELKYGAEHLTRSFNVYTCFLRLFLRLLGDEREVLETNCWPYYK